MIGAVIAAAGKSSRMGAFKPLLPLGGDTILGRVITALKSGGVGEIVVITGRDASLIEEALRGSGVQLIHNQDYETSDMFYSATLGIQFLAKRTDALFFTPVDVPLFRAATVEQLIAAWRTTGGDMVIPSFNDHPGHPVLFRSSAAAALLSYTGEGGLRGAMAAYRGAKITRAVDDPGICFDTDTPEEYALAQLMVDLDISDPLHTSG